MDAEKEADLKLWPHPSIEIFINPSVALAKSEDDFVHHVLETAPRRWISQAGWFTGTDAGVEATLAREAIKEAERFKKDAYARLGPTPLRLSFLKGLSAIKEENPEFYRELAASLKSGQGGSANYHKFMVRCGDLGGLLGLSANKVGALAKQLGLLYRPPWGFTFFGDRFLTSKLSPQGVLALWTYARERGLTAATCEQLIAFMRLASRIL